MPQANPQLLPRQRVRVSPVGIETKSWVRLEQAIIDKLIADPADYWTLINSMVYEVKQPGETLREAAAEVIALVARLIKEGKVVRDRLTQNRRRRSDVVKLSEAYRQAVLKQPTYGNNHP